MKEEDTSTLKTILGRCQLTLSHRPNVLRSLLTVQEGLGYVPPDAIAEIAHALGTTQADVAGVLSFYPDLRTRPTGRHLIRVCMGESCVANHCDRVLAAVCDEANIRVGVTTSDGRFTLECTSCVGNCAVSPTVIVDKEIHGRVTASEIVPLLKKYE